MLNYSLWWFFLFAIYFLVSGQAESGRPQHRITFKNGHEDTPRATPFYQKIKLKKKQLLFEKIHYVGIVVLNFWVVYARSGPHTIAPEFSEIRVPHPGVGRREAGKKR